jgi:hypothetical protein
VISPKVLGGQSREKTAVSAGTHLSFSVGTNSLARRNMESLSGVAQYNLNSQLSAAKRTLRVAFVWAILEICAIISSASYFRISFFSSSNFRTCSNLPDQSRRSSKKANPLDKAFGIWKTLLPPTPDVSLRSLSPGAKISTLRALRLRPRFFS